MYIPKCIIYVRLHVGIIVVFYIIFTTEVLQTLCNYVCLIMGHIYIYILFMTGLYLVKCNLQDAVVRQHL